MLIIPPPYQYITNHPQIFFEETISYAVSLSSYLQAFQQDYRIAIAPRSIQLYVGAILSSLYLLLSYSNPKRAIIIAHSSQIDSIILPSDQLKGFDSGNGKIISIDQEAIQSINNKIGITITTGIQDELFESHPAISIQIPYLRALTTVGSIIPIMISTQTKQEELGALLDSRYDADRDIIIFCANLADQIPFEQAVEQDANAIAASITNYQIGAAHLPVTFPTTYPDHGFIQIAFDRAQQSRQSLLRNVMYANTGQITGQHEQVKSFAGFVG